MLISLSVVTWLTLAVATAVAAESRGRSFLAWLAVGLVTGPAGLALILVQPVDPAAAERRALALGTHRQCPACVELVRRDASRCRHCGSDLPQAQPPAGRDTSLLEQDAPRVNLSDAIR